MSDVERKTVYFRSPGSQNTQKVVEAVKERVAANDGVKMVVVASTSGRTGVEFAKNLKGLATVVAVSHEEMSLTFKRQIVEYGGKAVDKTFLPLHARGMDDVRNSFYAFGQGFKVAVEVILIATERGEIKPYEDVISVGGTGTGSDTAIVARATTSKEIFSSDKGKKLEIREVLVMPLKKLWW